VRYGGPSALDCRWWGEVGGGDGPPLYDAALGRIEDGVFENECGQHQLMIFSRPTHVRIDALSNAPTFDTDDVLSGNPPGTI